MDKTYQIDHMQGWLHYSPQKTTRRDRVDKYHVPVVKKHDQNHTTPFYLTWGYKTPMHQTAVVVVVGVVVVIEMVIVVVIVGSCYCWLQSRNQLHHQFQRVVAGGYER